MIYIGIDPGLGGAIAAILATDGEVHLHPMPVISDPMAAEKGRKRMQVDPHALWEILQVYPRHKTRVVLEYTQAGMKGAIANYSLGKSSGIIEGVIGTMGFSYELVRPQEWKKAFGLLKTQKEASRAMAQRLFPMAELPLKKDEGKAEALLLAEWGRRHRENPLD